MKRYLCALLTTILFALVISSCGLSKEERFQKTIDAANQLLSEKSYEEAAQKFSDAIDIDPENADAYIGRGHCYLYSVRDHAAEIMEKGNVKLCEVADELTSHKEELENAEKDFQSAIDINTDLHDVWIDITTTRIYLGKYQEAYSALLNVTTKADPALMKDSLVALLDHYTTQGEYKTASEILQIIGEIFNNAEISEKMAPPIATALETGNDAQATLLLYKSLTYLYGTQYEGKNLTYNDLYSELVTDAFHNSIESSGDTIEFDIPKIHLAGQKIDALNTEIYNKYYPSYEASKEQIQEYGYAISSGGVHYKSSVNNDILSLVVYEYEDPESSGGNVYYVYNISVLTGEILSKADFLSYINLSEDDYNKKVEATLGSFYKYSTPSTDCDTNSMIDLYNTQLQKTIAKENIDAANPYLDESGHLSVTANIYSMAGGECYEYDLDLIDITSEDKHQQETTFKIDDNYAVPLQKLVPKINITPREAEKMAEKYFDIPESGIDEYGYEYGSPVSYFQMDKETGKAWYFIEEKCFVIDHMTTLGTINIDAETGAITNTDAYPDSEYDDDAKDGYLLPSDTRYLCDSELFGMSDDELSLALNEIYARHGYTFQSEKLVNYFSSKSWYTSNPNINSSNFDASLLNKFEKYNIDVIQGYQG